MFARASLPALPQSAIRLLELSRNPDNGPAEYAQPIEADPGLSSQVLRFVNSSYFGFSQEISNIRQAITLVGVRTIKNFALWSAVFSLLPNPKCGPFDLQCLWQDSLRRGLFARLIGKLLGRRDTEDIFTAALLQDLAIPFLAKEQPAQYRGMLEESLRTQTRLSILEQRQFGWHHGEVGGWLLRQWHLPEGIAGLVEGHSEVDRWLAEGPRQEAKLAVAMSALLPTVAGGRWHERERLVEVYGRLKGGRWPRLEEIFMEVDRDFADFAPILKITHPAKSLTATYQEAMASKE
ncbi:MAG: HDOD domain-containing protein [Thermoguttaceae bacterium]|nr:HDOD domain-containing protein [Thermoguttaceae bacterium]MDW8039406.1 HDOD domain-containing protein [Thermoguttaceae bacterium]